MEDLPDRDRPERLDRRWPDGVITPVVPGSTPRRDRPDGRHARRDRNRSATLSAVIELFGEGNLRPSAAEVAERSGVSLRSVFRYFEDTEDLLRAAVQHHTELAEPLFAMPDDAIDGDLDERLDRFVRRRMALYQEMAPTVRAARLAAGTDPRVARMQADSSERLRRQTAEVFAAELAAMDDERSAAVFAAVDTLTQFPGFKHLHSRALTDLDEAVAAVCAAMRILLTS